MTKIISCLFLLAVLTSATAQTRQTTAVGSNFSFSELDLASLEAATEIAENQLALPRIFPRKLPTPVSNQYYPISKSFHPQYETLRKEYEEKAAFFESSGSVDSAMFYLHDLVLIQEVLSGKKPGAEDQAKLSAYLLREKNAAQKAKNNRHLLDALKRLEIIASARGDIRSALSYAIERIAVYENGYKPTCNNCNTIPKNYVTAAIYHTQLNDKAGALQYYQKGIDRSRLPIDREYAAQQLIAYYIQAKEPAKALDLVNRTEKDSAARYLAFITFRQKAVVLYQLKKYDEALVYTGKAMEAEQTYSETRKKKFSKAPYDSLFANIYMALGQPYNALKYTNSTEIIDKVRVSAEQDKTLQNEKLLAARQKLEMERMKFDYESKQMALQRSSIKTAAHNEQLIQNARINLLNKDIAEQRRTRLILLSSLAALLGFLFLLFRNNRQKKKAFVQLNIQSELLREQKEELKATLENLGTTQVKLVQSEKLASLGELTAGIAHEIQNPLNFVNNFSEINIELLDEMKNAIDLGNMAELREIAGSIIANEQKINFHGRRADSIVKGMLQHSRASSGTKEPVDINNMVDEYLRLSYHGLRAKDKSFNAEMHKDFQASLEKITIIPQEFGRVLLNLFNNAFYSVHEKKKLSDKKYPDKKPGFEPIVFVKTRVKNNTLMISIRDNGMGIPNNIRGKIFQPFYTTKPTGEGTGLGLSMSYDIISQGHGGQIDIHSQPGEFAEFIITIPVTEK